MFEDDSHFGYRELVRHIALPRILRAGDWYVEMWGDFMHFEMRMADAAQQGLGMQLPSAALHGGFFWAPRSDQWDDLLTAAGCHWLDVEAAGAHIYVARSRKPRRRPRTGDGDGMIVAAGTGSSVAEAKASLWCYLTGHTGAEKLAELRRGAGG